MSHKRKLKLARKMMTPEEIKNGVSPFDSKAWNKRKEERAKRAEELEKKQKEAINEKNK